MSIADLCKITSLDEETIKEQVLPSLNALPTPTALRAHLESLIGFTPEARAFTSAFVSSRFSNSAPNSRPPSAPSTRPHTPNPPTSRPTQGSSLSLPSSQGPSTRPAQSTSRPAAASQGIDFPTRANAKAPLQLNDTQVLSLMSKEAKMELLAIDRGIKLLSPDAEGDRCFCQARKHSLSRYTTICPHCALLLCSLNSPAQPCPSCAHTPLLPAQQLSTSRLTEVQRRINLIENERERLLSIWQEQEAEAAREKFPSLAGKLSGDAMQTKIDAAYTKEEPRKVLTLNMKTKAVTASTKNPKAKVEEKKKAKTGPDVQMEEVIEDVLVPWLDDEDLGVQSKGKKKVDKFELVYVPLTVAEMREAKARRAEEVAEAEEVKPGGMRVRVPGMA